MIAFVVCVRAVIQNLAQRHFDLSNQCTITEEVIVYTTSLYRPKHQSQAAWLKPRRQQVSFDAVNMWACAL